MASRIPDGDIFGTAAALVTAHGFPRAKMKAEVMVSNWSVKDGPDSMEGLDRWERVRVAIGMMQSRLM